MKSYSSLKEEKKYVTVNVILKKLNYKIYIDAYTVYVYQVIKIDYIISKTLRQYYKYQ